MKEFLLIEAERRAYAPSQIHSTWTVGELMAALEEYDEDTPVLISNDAGYTFGPLGYSALRVEEFEEG